MTYSINITQKKKKEKLGFFKCSSSINTLYRFVHCKQNIFNVYEFDYGQCEYTVHLYIYIYTVKAIDCKKIVVLFIKNEIVLIVYNYFTITNDGMSGQNVLYSNENRNVVVLSIACNLLLKKTLIQLLSFARFVININQNIVLTLFPLQYESLQ